MAFFEELKRRRVTRVAFAYAVVSWVITEVLSTVLPALNLPEWTVTFIVVCLLVGFPIAMVLAWIFDVGPEGISRTQPADGAGAIRTRNRIMYIALMLVAMAGLGYLLYARGVNPSVAAGPRDSIAVLPFVNLSGDPSKDYFSDGMSEELLNLLVEVPGLKVAARTSSFAFKGKDVDVRKVARELGVATVLEGSVRQADDRVRITAQLIDAETGFHLWSGTYDNTLQDIFAVQDEIATAIVQALKIELAGGKDESKVAQRTAPPTNNVEAYQLYLQGRHYWKLRGEANVRRSLELYQQALGRDPGFARALSALASAWVVLPGYAGTEPEPAYEEAVKAARQALSLDPNLAEAHAVLAQVNASRANWLDAESGFFFATSLDPTEPTPHHWYSLLLRQVGRLDAALLEAQKAYEMDDSSPIIAANLANVQLDLGQNDEGARLNALAEHLGLEQDPSGVAATLAQRRGDYAAAARLIAASPKTPPKIGPLVYEFFDALAHPENRADVLAKLKAADITPLGPIDRVMPYAQLGDVEDAMQILLEIARSDQRESIFDHVPLWAPEAAPLRRDPRFAEVARRLGFIDYWKQYGYADDCQPTEDRASVTCH
jgi:adenylate cyclase